ncbi:MGDG synthase family glycosyltransferase [Thermaerobacillus caldiproteolyticus]|uniref:MGDG synthase family glycosyltransferase n=1 Tax=Thermaerobacillus caldiproteolyticus TaxID=247480 RepID=UPI00188C45ED|nr:galactosyldiacylglycerol synthase [Anoxybacillus caldiproteolyticus]QPA29958.1 galactosyldiacylglycerol synthase [Anoxybacillus caldiproteolyticus]
MKRVLFLPLLQIPSGHHQTADALKEGLLLLDPHIQCEKIELLSSKFGKVESFISKFYLQWIDRFPKTYSLLYRQSVFRELGKTKKFPQYEVLFLNHLKKVISKTNPNVIICTHALPSYLLSKLKAGGELKIPVINVYTDYFIHDLWGIEEIDYHLVGHPHMKEFLREKGVHESRIFVTGIPIHPKITKNINKYRYTKRLYCGLISGGSLGAGALAKLIEKISLDDRIDYYVLCGKNRRIYEQLINMNHPKITPFPYISSREEMNDLYNQVDFIITKPGGVTVSECLFKKIPIFVYHALPGQEEINLQQLKEWGMIFDFQHWNKTENISEQLIRTLHSEHLSNYFTKLDEYHKNLSPVAPAKLIYHLVK